MLILYRWGDHLHNPTGNGYSGGEASWVVMPSLRSTNAGIGNLSHEVGHYFGLGHTFARQFESVAKASVFLKDHGGDTTVFDGDRLGDTLPDPGLDVAFNNGVKKVTLDRTEVPLPTGNIMSYMNWDGHEWISNQQAERTRAFYRFRSRFSMVYPTNIDAPSPIEAESLGFATRGDLSAQPQRMERFGTVCWSGDEQVWANGRPGGSLVLKFDLKEPGHKDVYVYMTSAEDYGKVEFSIDGERVGQTFDGFAPLVAASGSVSLGRHDLSRGEHAIEFTLVGKNQESTGTGLGIDCVSLVPIKVSGSGWVSLFNGRDLSGWKTHPQDHARWDVRNGILIGSGSFVGHLFSQRGDYKNFHFRVEAKINDAGNGGQYFRTKFEKGFPSGYEAQINSTGSDPVKTGSLFNLAPIEEMLVKPNEWFTQEVIADGNHIVILVNGNKVVDYVDQANMLYTPPATWPLHRSTLRVLRAKTQWSSFARLKCGNCLMSGRERSQVSEPSTSRSRKPWHGSDARPDAVDEAAVGRVSEEGLFLRRDGHVHVLAGPLAAPRPGTKPVGGENGDEVSIRCQLPVVARLG